MKIYKIFCLICVKTLLITRANAVTPPSCMSDPTDTTRWYSFVSQNIINIPSDMRSYLMDTRKLADYYESQMYRQEVDNIDEWRGRFCSIPDTAAIRYIVYAAGVDELEDLHQAASSKNPDISYRLEGNRFAQVLKENRCVETIDYLLFAKACEPHVLAQPNWGNRQTRDFAAMAALIKRGREEFRVTKSVFIKHRYAYQMIRLAHYAKDYASVLALCEELMPKLERIQSIINYWIIGHKAGALLQTGKRAEAAYHYSLVFRHCPSKRESAYRSFDIRTAEEWKSCLNLCQNNEQRATLYGIRAASPASRSLEDMKSLYQLEPKSSTLELLLLRETAKLEKILLGKDFRAPRYPQPAREKAAQYLLDFRDFVHQCSQEGTVKTPVLWQIAEGYLTVLAGDYYHARVLFEKARPLVTDGLVLEQLETFDMAARIGLMTLPKDVEGNKAWQEIRTSPYYNAHTAFERFFREKAGNLYRKAGMKGMSYFCDYGLEDLALNPQAELVDDMLAVCKKPNMSSFERELVLETQRQNIEQDLLDIKGTDFLRKYQLEAALQCFQQIPPASLKQVMFNPFTERIKDCVRCSVADSVLYDKAQLIQKILDLEFQARAAPDEAAKQYYLIGLAYYNMSYFGHCHKAMDFYRSGASWYSMHSGKDIFEKRGRPNGNHENLDLSQALKYFEMARKATRDPELGAKSAFWAAKCDLVSFYRSPDNQYRIGSRTIPRISSKYLRYYDLLNSGYYNKTIFYTEVVKECKFFAYYARR
jgi:hypothetical protein